MPSPGTPHEYDPGRHSIDWDNTRAHLIVLGLAVTACLAALAAVVVVVR